MMTMTTTSAINYDNNDNTKQTIMEETIDNYLLENTHTQTNKQTNNQTKITDFSMKLEGDLYSMVDDIDFVQCLLHLM